MVGPQRADQLVTADVARAVQQQVGEQQRHLLAPQAVSKLRTIDLYGQPSAKLDSCPLLRWCSYRQRSGNVSTTRTLDGAKRGNRGHERRCARRGATRGGAKPQ